MREEIAVEYHTCIIFLENMELSSFTVLQLLILWDRNNCYRRFNLPFVVSILFKTLQVLIVSVTHPL
jgi:hypothetical protein